MKNCLFSFFNQVIVSKTFHFIHVKESDTIRNTEIELINNFRELNEQGQFEANKRVAELTEIVKYLKIKDNNSDK